MNCKRVQKYLTDYQAGLLDSYIHDLVDRHLSECAECRAILKTEESVTDFLRSFDSPESGTGIDLASEVFEKVKGQTKTAPVDPITATSRMSARMQWGLIAIMIITFLLIGLFVFPFQSSEDQYHTSYSPGVGYTWMGAGMESLDTEHESDENIIGIMSGGSLSVYTGANLQEDSPEDSGRITHTFDLSPTEETPLPTERSSEEE